MYYSQLLQLFLKCLVCGTTDVNNQAQTFGTCIRITQTCSFGHKYTWDSQTRIGRSYGGNILLPAAILFSGGSVSKVIRIFNFLSCLTISENTFYRYQRDYLQPAIRIVWSQEQEKLLAAAHSANKPLCLGGDARCDSPGHSAKFGSYSIIDLCTNKVLDVQLVQVCLQLFTELFLKVIFQVIYTYMFHTE